MSREKSANNTLSIWQEEGHRLIHQNYEVFLNLVAQAKSFVRVGDYNMAAIYGDMAGEYASWMQHCGLFVSLELENLFLEIGHKAISKSRHTRQTSEPNEKPKKILHVVPNVANIGGHSRLLWRWIQNDSERTHSIVFTAQEVCDIPEVLRDAVFSTHGKIYTLNQTVGNIISQAKRLRKIASSMDIVVLHTIYDYSVPMIAFSDKDQSPPIIYVNHADERFWVGVSISNAIANLRESGMRLSKKRRNIEEKRNLLLPIVLSPVYRTHSRKAAKQELGFAEDSIILLSIARAIKYRTDSSMSFADAHVSLLKRYENVILVVIGPGDEEDWSAAIEQTQGRIKVLGHTKETGIYYQAADIYVDSFPFMSNTSLLEAGSYGLPLVSRYPYSSDACEIFGADMPGLTGNLIRVFDLNEYTQVLSNLITDDEFRLTLGETTKRKIEQTHLGHNWQNSLEALYSYAINLPRTTHLATAKDRVSTGEPDIYLQKVFPFILNIDKLTRDRVRLMPFNKRFVFWFKEIKKGNVGRIGNIHLLLPEWLYRRLRELFRLKYPNQV